MDKHQVRLIVNSHSDGNLQITTEMVRTDLATNKDTVTVMMREIINTKEDRIKQALIELGWTPPKEGCNETQ